MSIVFKSVFFSYEDQIIFSNLSLEMKDNAHTIILGRSGCGKTTLLKLITGKLQPNSGKIEGLAKKSYSILFQEDRLIEHLDALQNIKYVLYGKNIEDFLIIDTLKQLGIHEYKGKPVGEFSGGMKRRVAICRALLFPSDILILDEPFRSLDNDTSLEILPILEKFFKNRTVISVLHQKEIAQKLNAKIIML